MRKRKAASARILYCGDHALDDAARYLAGSLLAAGWHFDYLPSCERWTRAIGARKYSLYILSDYPSRQLGALNARRLAERVHGGAGLLMIGGWGSFSGVDGNYGKTALADALPVRCLPKDDRQQGAGAYRLAPGRDFAHWPDRKEFNLTSAPTIAGYNKTVLKPGARELLSVQTLAFDGRGGASRVIASGPLLAVWNYGHGRVTAYGSDLAPHWSGGLVDWGPKRLTLKVAPGIEAEVGSTFARFAAGLVRQTFSAGESRA